ncbi:hypothetical protein TVAG_102560 [Trichomonas vaginalis G3]|uniref:RRM domain-containing protein n=1 Tax=Trichomonas vaginalis (strain ATCC PRA-98 / G3) TaxID=412133 RepID=A2ECW2_TRIV3|nr:RNA-binding domain, RBD family-containing protein [Trichomonas vaginalis G3]EAY09507.1 hypothetical protein TVAG_102560 [Trichomonas vaginalis G3]KAI5521460.1 RNA-binding domain, RBD family-containing protein [Trichomonas vaginalis G3]|eukprot:XP_001321730.1 hypothetical protein [Trichomonas vaginalis G3]
MIFYGFHAIIINIFLERINKNAVCYIKTFLEVIDIGANAPITILSMTRKIDLHNIPANTVIKVTGVGKHTSPEFIGNAFSTFGKIVYVHIPKLDSERIKPYAYIAFATPAAAQNALDNGKKISLLGNEFVSHPFSLDEFQRNDLNSTFDVKKFVIRDRDAEYSNEKFVSPKHIGACYAERPDRADPLNEHEFDFDVELARKSIVMERVYHIYNFGFGIINKEDGIPENILPKVP